LRGLRAQLALASDTGSSGANAMQSALRWRAVGMCFRKHPSEQNRSLSRPELQEETEQRYATSDGPIDCLHMQHLLALATINLTGRGNKTALYPVI